MQQQNSVSSPLTYAIRLSVVAKYLGIMFLLSVAFLSVPLVISFFWQEFNVSLRYGISVVLFLGLGLLTLKLPHPKTIQSNEVCVIIALTFVIGSLVNVIPIMGSGLNFIDAWFEAVSGITTTGLSTVDLNVIESRTFFFSRAWLQWYGGLGILIFSLGFVFQPGQISKALFKQASSKDDLFENSKIFARKMLIIYSIFTLFGVLLLKLVGLPFLDSLLYSFSSISTGGFATSSTSLEDLPLYIQSSISLLGFLGALSLPLFWISETKDLKQIVNDAQFRAMVVSCLVVAIFMILLFSQNWFTFIPTAILSAVSMQSTTGYSLFDLSTLNESTKLICVVSMFIGGSTQSTAGGLKLIRLLMIFAALRYLFHRTALVKHAVEREGFRQESGEMRACFNIFALYMIVAFLSTLIFVIMKYDPLNALFDVVSALGTVGVSSGLTEPGLPLLLKYVLIFDMLLGRLEIVALLVLFYPKTLIGRRMDK